MAYDDITDAELDAESPVTESLMRKLRDNPVEIADAGSGAPRVRVAALETAQDRADAGTGLATAGMVPVATGGDGAEWDFVSPPGWYAHLTTAGWQNVVAVSSGEKYKIDGTYETREAGDVFWRGTISAFVGEDESGRWSMTGIEVDETVGTALISMTRTTNLVNTDTLFRVSGGYIQVQVGYPTGGSVSAGCTLTYVRCTH